MELVNVDKEVMIFAETLLNMDISSPVPGQLALDILLNPPQPSEPSYDLYTQVVEQATHHGRGPRMGLHSKSLFYCSSLGSAT
jgi:hypothetical protein